jgi:protein phosphatase methylesterase 1
MGMSGEYAHGILLCAMDLRGHGRTDASQSVGMSRAQLVNDTKGVIWAVLQDLLGVDAHATSFYVIGHSLGGAVAAALGVDDDIRKQIAGLAMLDIVEDTALFGLRHMPAFLEKRPVSFGSVDEACRWYVADGGMRTLGAAAISVPRTLRHDDSDGNFHWVTDLGATAEYWEGWFTGMNGLFVSASCPKMLLLANTDRLDKGLTLAMMQGKFQLEVVRDSGHHVQEDQPGAVAQKVFRFVTRIDKLMRALPPVAPKLPVSA